MVFLIRKTGVDIRLGDVVVSEPHGTLGGVVQYDKGKAKEDEFELKGYLNGPPNTLLTALAFLKGEHDISDSLVPNYLADMFRNRPKMSKTGYRFPGSDQDYLPCDHRHQSTESERYGRCNENRLIPSPRKENMPEIQGHMCGDGGSGLNEQLSLPSHQRHL